MEFEDTSFFQLLAKWKIFWQMYLSKLNNWMAITIIELFGSFRKNFERRLYLCLKSNAHFENLITYNIFDQF